MTVPAPTRAEPAPGGAVPALAGDRADDDVWKARIASAVWTEIHWLMPADRKVRIDIEGDDIAVAFVPAVDRRPGPH